MSLNSAIEKYLVEIRRFRAPKTIAGCENTLGRFNLAFTKKPLHDVSREDLLDHMFSLKSDGLGNRTIHNHMCRIEAFLKANGISGLLRSNDKPAYDKKDVSAYGSDELAKFLAVVGPEDRLLFEFFLGTGFREQEVMQCTWSNIDFKGRVIGVKSKPEFGFRVKDKEERSVPVPDALIAALTERKRRSTSMLVFPSPRGTPDGHMLRRLQTLAHRAGLNCGECRTKNKQRCSDRPVCSKWGLHKFRKTFATMHSEAGVSPPTFQRWLGHSDLATTLRYLAVADMRSERTRSQVNSTFAGLGLGGAA